MFASYLQEIALAKIVLWGWAMKGMAWRWPSLPLSPDVWPVSDPEPGLGRKAEGGQQWVHNPGWAAPLGLAAISLVCRYADRRCSYRHQGILNWLEQKNMQQEWPSCSPLSHYSQPSSTHHSSILTVDTANWAEAAVNEFCLVWPNLTAFCVHVSSFLERAPSSHNALQCYQWETSIFPAFSQTPAIFPCSPFRKPIWGIDAITNGEWKK